MKTLLKKYAQLVVRSGVNLQKNQTLLVKASVDAVEFTRLVVEEAYAIGAKEVVVTYQDEVIAKAHYLHQSEETLQEVHEWQVASSLDYLKEGACVLSIISPLPGSMKDCDSNKINLRQKALSIANKEVRKYTMSSIVQWCVVAVPNPIWASMVFPSLDKEAAQVELWKQIFACTYIEEAKDPIVTWQKRDDMFAQRIAKMNESAYRQLHFTSENGTDLYVGLVDHHIWGGGSELSASNVSFNANIPTEEIFTMPHKNRVHGRVVASRPLLHNGNLIEDFTLDFEDGKVINFYAKEGQEVLSQLLQFDEGSARLGEVALVPYDSPISQSGILFLTTLFDENASCHLALGDTYPSCVEGGVNMSEDELSALGGNQSMVHVDFMFGTKDMCVQGEDANGQWHPIFVDGNFVI